MILFGKIVEAAVKCCAENRDESLVGPRLAEVAVALPQHLHALANTKEVAPRGSPLHTMVLLSLTVDITGQRRVMDVGDVVAPDVRRAGRHAT